LRLHSAVRFAMVGRINPVRTSACNTRVKGVMILLNQEYMNAVNGILGCFTANSLGAWLGECAACGWQAVVGRVRNKRRFHPPDDPVTH
jgi:hypothetical protein